MTTGILAYSTLLQRLEYNPGTGIFTWKSRPKSHFNKEADHGTWNTRYAGKEAGCVSHGYIQIVINTKQYLAHRLAWMYVHGIFPKKGTDHINGIKSDNRIDNLRDVSQKENCRNRSIQSTNTSGITGVGWHKHSKKWRAYIEVDGEHISLGNYSDIEDAKTARKSAEIKYGFHENHGRQFA